MNNIFLHPLLRIFVGKFSYIIDIRVYVHHTFIPCSSHDKSERLIENRIEFTCASFVMLWFGIKVKSLSNVLQFYLIKSFNLSLCNGLNTPFCMYIICGGCKNSFYIIFYQQYWQKNEIILHLYSGGSNFIYHTINLVILYRKMNSCEFFGSEFGSKRINCVYDAQMSTKTTTYMF